MTENPVELARQVMALLADVRRADPGYVERAQQGTAATFLRVAGIPSEVADELADRSASTLARFADAAVAAREAAQAVLEMNEELQRKIDERNPDG